MKIKYGCTYWGSERFKPKEFIAKVADAGYEGVELFLQPPDTLTDEFLKAIEEIRNEKPDFYFILLQLTFPGADSVNDYISKMEKQLLTLAKLSPLFINSHTGRDYFSFDDNCRAIETAMNVSAKTGVRILHETHRGRFSFHAATLFNYLKQFPEIELVGDFSHFCTVSESMLEDQQHILKEIIPHISHIHARVGFEQGPQVNDPAAPEWQSHLNIFINWWQEVIEYKSAKGSNLITMTPEFGPAPYMTQMPVSQTPLSDQWNDNIYMMEKLREKFS